MTTDAEAQARDSALQAAAEKATPGPYRREWTGREFVVVAEKHQAYGGVVAPGIRNGDQADYLALCSPERILSFLADVRRLREALQLPLIFHAGGEWTLRAQLRQAEELRRTQLHDAEVSLRQARNAEEEARRALESVLREEQIEGRYVHLPECNGDRRQPPGVPGHSCSCRVGRSRNAAFTQQRDALVALLHQPHFGDLASCRAAQCVDARALLSGKA